MNSALCLSDILMKHILQLDTYIYALSTLNHVRNSNSSVYSFKKNCHVSHHLGAAGSLVIRTLD
jgi:hypothetical protein